MQSSHTIEKTLLIACAKRRGDTASLSLDAADDLDWSFILHQAQRHGLLPLFHRYLLEHDIAGVPAKVFSQIESQTHKLAVANLFQTQELLRVVSLLEANGIETMPFKGPTLGFYLFGNLALRTFSDLDILIHKKDFERVKALLLNSGYNPFREFNREEEQAFLNTQMGFEFVRQDERSVIEVHWAFLNKVHAFKMKPAEVWLHKKRIVINGLQLNMIAPAHLLVYLCAHGSKSFWSRLRWISDVAEMIHKHSDAKFWNDVEAVAKDSRSERMLYLGLNLAHAFFEAPLPVSIQNRIKEDVHVQTLTEWVRGTIFTSDQEEDLSFQQVKFHLAMRERFMDRLPYLRHVLRLWLSPSRKDKAFIDLPRRWEFLYLLLKPFRFVKDRLN